MMIPLYYVPIALVIGAIVGAAVMACCCVAWRADRVSEDVIRRIELEEVK